MSPCAPLPGLRRLLLALLITFLPALALSQEVPGTRPREELEVELLQARSYCRGLELQIEKVRKMYPKLKVELLAAETSWKASPFYQASKSIDEGMRAQVGKAATDFLKDIDAKGLALMKELGTDPKTELEAKIFLASLETHAKGKFAFPSVRGNLLWQYKPYQDKPEKEFEHGFVESVQHPLNPGLSLKVPMSWKAKPSKSKDTLAFSNNYGHGFITFNFTPKPYPLLAKLVATPQETFDSITKEITEEEYKELGMTLKTFSKTQLNGMPAVIITVSKPVEQLGTKLVLEFEVIQVLAKKQMLIFSLCSPGPADSDAGLKRLQKNEPLFKAIVSSLEIAKE